MEVPHLHRELMVAAVAVAAALSLFFGEVRNEKSVD
jgi:hypothetical protein